MPRGIAEKHDLNTMLLPNTASPLGSIQNPATGANQTLRGNLALVNSPEYHSRYDDSSHYNLFAPSVGLAYQLFRRNVIRAGYTLAYLPNDTGVPSPTITPITVQTTPVLGTLSNPFPADNEWYSSAADRPESRLQRLHSRREHQWASAKCPLSLCTAMELQYPAGAQSKFRVAGRLHGIQRHASETY